MSHNLLTEPQQFSMNKVALIVNCPSMYLTLNQIYTGELSCLKDNYSILHKSFSE